MIEIDAITDNADWLKRQWTLPSYKTKAFNKFLKAIGMTLVQFRKTSLYASAIEQGAIKDDKWVGGKG
jgi:hypothetical protein